MAKVILGLRRRNLAILMGFLPIFGDFLHFCWRLLYRRYFWYRGSETIFSCFHRLRYIGKLPELARTHRVKPEPYHSKVAFSLRFLIKLQILTKNDREKWVFDSGTLIQIASAGILS